MVIVKEYAYGSTMVRIFLSLAHVPFTPSITSATTHQGYNQRKSSKYLWPQLSGEDKTSLDDEDEAARSDAFSWLPLLARVIAQFFFLSVCSVA